MFTKNFSSQKTKRMKIKYFGTQDFQTNRQGNFPGFFVNPVEHSTKIKLWKREDFYETLVMRKRALKNTRIS